jgi:uncharacterized protein YndB with AHSA1/START domain
MTQDRSSRYTVPEGDRELRASVVVDATSNRVWQVLTDLDRMPEWSPELVRMVPLKRGGLRVGQWYLGLNRRGAVVWPTRSVVREVVPGRSMVWDTTSSGARWIYELTAEGERSTRLSLTRPVPGPPPLTARLFTGALLGGVAGHDDELEAGMATTLERFKAAVETGS